MLATLAARDPHVEKIAGSCSPLRAPRSFLASAYVICQSPFIGDLVLSELRRQQETYICLLFSAAVSFLGELCVGQLFG